jgi:membrane associated rhomboid family serine protease
LGIYDRDYYHSERSEGRFSWSSVSVVGMLILVNIAVYIAELFSSDSLGGCQLYDLLATHASRQVDRLAWWQLNTLTHPWLWWQYLTAGFTHDPDGLGHIVGNMLALFFLGRDVEDRYGSREFLRFYLATLVFADVAWTTLNLWVAPHVLNVSFGASGAITGIVILYVFNFPNRMLLLFFVIPIPVWICGVLFVVMDMFGFLGVGPKSNVAHSAHLAGALFGFLYYKLNWNLTAITDKFLSRPIDSLKSLLRGKPKLRVHHYDRDAQDEPPRQESKTELTREVDRILEKISRQGEASLTPEERQTLEAASREFQRRRR